MKRLPFSLSPGKVVDGLGAANARPGGRRNPTSSARERASRMKVFNTSFKLQTEGRTEVSDITKRVRDALHESSVTTGIALVNTLHTTCALFINEFQSALMDDIV